ncbi:decaprenyl-phosphate phosphoribosyltransferase [Geomonas sp. Red69]|uniref:decaprenyl-phosphate phosphoribosyltransferase n=1 Tax=Geomonas diazotrophica TaxID=2843197 RepID=UPI001C100174|nr:decaprenyl-phosphate phosphoribosyltransferase [Geomonas diazotrophica]MBU5636467.1 decaprenyl-phosphate phosphoribosyltransferase [Geomonas diazotrophica]
MNRTTFKYLVMLRPKQWLKNLMIFFPPFLGGAILAPGVPARGAVPFAAFCLAASSTYVLNDLCDRHNDSHHPVKRHRPIPSGAVSPSLALAICVLLLVPALWLGWLVSPVFLLLLVAYLAISVCYSLKLKEIPVLDLFCISSGFLLRLQAGGEAFGILVSPWLFLSVFLLSLFLSTGKRLGELNALGEGAGAHRKSLLHYPEGVLDLLLAMTGAAVLVTYTLYVVTRPALVYTVILCCFGLFRFVLRVKSGLGGDPTESLLKDRQLLAVSVLWALMFAWIVYR